MSIPPPILYLGNDLIINGSDVHFNAATVSVKGPSDPLNVANKEYVDNVSATITSLISSETATREAQDSSMLSQINTLQSEIDGLITQMNNIYQYFFNQNGDGPALVR